MKAYFSILILVFHFSLKAMASEELLHKIQLGITSSHIGVDTKSSTTTEGASTSFNSISLNPIFNYFITPQSAATISYFKSLSGKYATSGASIGYKYYFLQGTTVLTETENKKIKVSPTWSPYVSLSYKLLTISADDGKIDFDGLEVEAGTDYQISELYYLNIKASYGRLTSGSTRNSSPIGLGFAVGKSL